MIYWQNLEVNQVQLIELISDSKKYDKNRVGCFYFDAIEMLGAVPNIKEYSEFVSFMISERGTDWHKGLSKRIYHIMLMNGFESKASIKYAVDNDILIFRDVNNKVIRVRLNGLGIKGYQDLVNWISGNK